MAEHSPSDSLLEACRSSLDAVIRDSRQQAQALEALLASEQTALRDQDSEALEIVAAKKLDCVTTLDALENTRRGIATDAGFAADPTGMNDLIAWCDQGDALHDEWTALLAVARRCEQQNRSNGAVSHVRAQQIRAALAILSGNPDATHIYSPSGIAAGGNDHREIARA
ncbi:MAG: flagellar protein FlgN [Pseudomonadota bacterium]